LTGRSAIARQHAYPTIASDLVPAFQLVSRLAEVTAEAHVHHSWPLHKFRKRTPRPSLTCTVRSNFFSSIPPRLPRLPVLITTFWRLLLGSCLQNHRGPTAVFAAQRLSPSSEPQKKQRVESVSVSTCRSWVTVIPCSQDCAKNRVSIKLRLYEFVIRGKSRRVEMSYNGKILWIILLDFPHLHWRRVCQGNCGMLCDPINSRFNESNLHRACASEVVPRNRGDGSIEVNAKLCRTKTPFQSAVS